MSTKRSARNPFARGAYRAIAFFYPFTFIASIASIAKDLMPGIGFLGAFFWVAISVAGLLPIFLSFVFRQERVASTANVRAFALTIIAFWIAGAICAPRHVPSAFAGDAGSILAMIAKKTIPSPETIVALIAASAQWIWTGVVEGFFRERELLFEYIGDKNGTELYSAIREDGYLVSDAASSLKRFSSSLVISCIVLFLMAVTLTAVGFPPKTASIAFIACFLFLTLLTGGILRVFRDEQSFVGLGLGAAFSLTPARVRQYIAILVLSVILAFLLSSDVAILPPSFFVWIWSLIQWVLSLLAGKQQSGIFEPPAAMSRPERNPFEELARVQDKPILNLAPLIGALKVVAIAALAVGILWFLFGAFFRRDMRDFFREKRISRYARAFIELLRNFFATLFSRREPIGRGEGFSRAAFASAMRQRARKEKSPAKRREIGRLTAEFVKIVDWGDARGIPCEASSAPFEYAERLARSVPEAKENLLRAATLFERALYSDELLTKDEVITFARAIAAVVAI